jgi:hypothetical protein
MEFPKRAAVVGFAIAAAVGFTALFAQSRNSVNLSVARYTADGRLAFPEGTDRWIAIGTGLGGDYEETVFDPANPGSLNVVQMEPSAYEFFSQNGRYADGTMLLLTFYRTLEKPEPALRGFVQGEVALREIHVIDKVRYASEGRAFFAYPPGTDSVAPFAEGSECVVCHSEHGAYDATFTQFYPVIRDRVDN